MIDAGVQRNEDMGMRGSSSEYNTYGGILSVASVGTPVGWQ
jgi:hypothetical protein